MNQLDIDQISEAINRLFDEKRDAEQFLRLIAPEYMGVYVLDRETDCFRDILGPDYFRNIVKEKNGHYSEGLKIYRDQYVAEEDRSIITYMLDYDRIYDVLLSGKEVNLSYRKKDNSNIALRIRRYSQKKEEENLSVWIYTNDELNNQKREDKRQQQLSEAYEKIRKSNEELKLALDRLQEDKDILDRLCTDFTAVYVVNLDTGKYETLKLLDTTNAKDMIKKAQSSYEHFNDYTDHYADIYLTEENRCKFRHWFSCRNLKEQLTNKDRAVFHYKSIPNKAGCKYFEVQALKVNNHKECPRHIALIGLRYIDDIIEKEKSIQEKLQTALDEAELRNEIISAIGKSYYYISRIDLEEDYYELVSGFEKFPENVKKKGYFSKNVYQNCKEIVDETYLDDLIEFLDISTLADRLQSEESIFMEYRMKNGDWRRVRLIAKKRNEQGRVTHVLCAVRNISNEKRKELELKLKAQDARREIKEKTRFLSNMSHDIRTPMNGIVGLINMAEQYPEDMDIQARCRAKIKELSGHLVSLVNDILDINKLQSDDFVIQNTTFDIAEMLRTLNEASHIEAANKNIEYVVNWEESKLNHRYLVGSPDCTARILSIFSDNAIKFSHAGSRIVVGCIEKTADDENVVYTFFCRDNGIGMSEEFAEHAFDMFSQENETSRTNYEGSGLGLAIAKRLADRLHGKISIESEKGVGTTATLELSFKIGNPDDIPVTYALENISLQGLRALIAEDNELNMEIAKFILEQQGIITECASNGLECVRMFEESEPGYYDVILMDIMMPELNGLDAARKIRTLQRKDAEKIPIIAMSANALADDIIKSKLAGLNEHLTKPLDGKKVMEAIQKSLQPR